MWNFRLNFRIVSQLSQDAQLQIARVADYFQGATGRTNYYQLRLFAETMAARYKMISGWATRNGEDFLHEAVASCLTPGANGDCIRRIPPEIPVKVALIKILESLVNHAYHAKGRRLSGEMPASELDSAGGKLVPFEPKETMWSEGDDRLTQQEREGALARFEAFVAFARPDSVVHGMLLLIKNEGIDRPASLIAERLHVPEIEIYQARKRLASAVGRYLKQLRAA